MEKSKKEPTIEIDENESHKTFNNSRFINGYM